MRFLLKMFVFGFIGLAILPSVAPEEYRRDFDGADGGAQAPTALDLASLVGRAASDVRGICDRQPGVCETGEELIAYTGTKAREGLDIAYAMFRHGHPLMKAQEADATATAAE